MKQTLKLLTALLLAPLAALQAAPSADCNIIISSEAGAKLDSDASKDGGMDDTSLIQSILDRALKLGTLKLVVDGPILVKGLKVHSNTTIECLIGTSMDRSALNAFMDARAGIVTPPGKGMRGWPEACGYLTSQPQIQRLQIDHVVAEGLEHVLDHRAGTIEALDLRDLSIPAMTQAVHQGGEAKRTKNQGASVK